MFNRQDILKTYSFFSFKNLYCTSPAAFSACWQYYIIISSHYISTIITILTKPFLTMVWMDVGICLRFCAFGQCVWIKVHMLEHHNHKIHTLEMEMFQQHSSDTLVASVSCKHMHKLNKGNGGPPLCGPSWSPYFQIWIHNVHTSLQFLLLYIVNHNQL